MFACVHIAVAGMAAAPLSAAVVMDATAERAARPVTDALSLLLCLSK